MSFLSLFGDKKVDTTTTSVLNTTNNTTADSYNTQNNVDLTRNDSRIQANSTVQNTALDFISTYNLADTGNIYAGEAGGFAGLGTALDLNAFFEATRPVAPASANITDWNKGNTLADKFAGLSDLQDTTLKGQAAQTVAAAPVTNNALYWVIGIAMVALVALVYFKRKK